MLPESGFKSPAMIERRVDLPHPDGPTIEVKVPGIISIDTCDSASTRCLES